MDMNLITKVLALLAFLAVPSNAFASSSCLTLRLTTGNKHSSDLSMAKDIEEMSRRNFMSSAASGIAALVVSPVLVAAEGETTLGSNLYTILRVREATLQEARLINSGKFKDVQRANVKLAIRFMLKNYRLADTFIAASAYLEDNNKRISAGEVGSSVVQNLQTILEYFDSADVANLKVGDSMAGKEKLVLRGLDSARQSIDDFLAFFPPAAVAAVRSKILEENELNQKEWDPALGEIVNMPSLV